METKIANDIKYRKHANDEFYTPVSLAKELIKLVPANRGDLWIDNAPKNPVFYKNYPDVVVAGYCADFFKVEPHLPVDWFVTNPPYSKLDDWFAKSTMANRGFAYLLGFHNITPKRIELCEKAGFGLTKIHLCKVFKWFGISAFCVFEKGKQSIIQYDRIVHHAENE